MCVWVYLVHKCCMLDNNQPYERLFVHCMIPNRCHDGYDKKFGMIIHTYIDIYIYEHYRCTTICRELHWIWRPNHLPLAVFICLSKELTKFSLSLHKRTFREQKSLLGITGSQSSSCTLSSKNLS